jgi:hypothetical protein
MRQRDSEAVREGLSLHHGGAEKINRVPAKAGIHWSGAPAVEAWVPAFAGTRDGVVRLRGND